ncbi:hypothetical protein CSB37_03105 [bacterium DOLZORAL124_38_8]|nr:MAG: hypothetical protein CSB37_03105 [bacterium DOLZORAL124_38_8]
MNENLPISKEKKSVNLSITNQLEKYFQNWSEEVCQAVSLIIKGSIVFGGLYGGLYIAGQIEDSLAKHRLIKMGFSADAIESVSNESDIPYEDIEDMLKLRDSQLKNINKDRFNNNIGPFDTDDLNFFLNLTQNKGKCLADILAERTAQLEGVKLQKTMSPKEFETLRQMIQEKMQANDTIPVGHLQITLEKGLHNPQE